MNSETNAAPYHNDYDENKNFAQILFRPGVYVQTRELNQLQSILQNQISRFGDNVLKQGTIVSGCNINHLSGIPYVKLKDKTTTGAAVDVTSYVGKLIRNSANTVAVAVTGIQGFESNSPDLNTVYVKYINSGNSKTETSFAADQTLTIYDPTYRTENVKIIVGSNGYANTDTIHFLSALQVANTTGGNTFSSGLYVGDRLYDGQGANVVIKSITYNSAGAILGLAPIGSDHLASNTAAWSLTQDSTLVNANTAQNIVLSSIVGSGARANVATDGVGSVSKIDVYANGSGYVVAPTAFILSSTATSTQLQNTSLVAENFSAQVTVAPSLQSPIGKAYALSIDEGIVYQGGYFTRADKQLVIVGKYSTLPDDVAVGFDTSFSIVTEEEDESLLDNQYGTPNYLAPGAHRLKTTASAIVLSRSEAASRPNFLSIVELTQGEPYKMDTQTQYNVIEQRLAQRTAEESGNYVIDPFSINTKSPVIASEPTVFNLVVDPGVAYIDGYRVATERNFTTNVNKGTTTTTLANTVSSVSYGSYVYVTDIIGSTATLAGALVSLRSVAYVGAIGAIVSQPGTEIGQARIKAVQATRRGTVNQYKVFLFDVKMNAGTAFADIRALSTSAFVASIDTTLPVALSEPSRASSVVKLPVDAISSVTNITYTRQKSDWGALSANTSGAITLTVSAPDMFPVAGTIGPDELNNIIVTPTANAVSTAPLTGTVTLSSGNAVITGAGTLFSTQLVPGKYIRFVNSSASFDTRVVGITNATSMSISPVPGVAMAGNTHILFPANIPAIPSSVVVSGDRTGMTISLGANIPSTSVSVLTPVNTTLTPGAKTVARNAVARMNLATHPTGTLGPWCVGVSDVIRLVGVYMGTSTTFTSATGGVVDVTNHFYIDNDQGTESIGAAYMYRKANSSLVLDSAKRLLVVFDVMSHSSTSGKTVGSYPINDGLALAASAATVNTLELPEVFGQYNQYYDVRDCVDFRPLTANTIAIQTTQSTAPINPAEPVYASKYASIGSFPAPDTTITSTITYYKSRRDRVVVTSDGHIRNIAGLAGTNELPEAPSGSITINDLKIPPYPSLANALSTDMAVIADTRIASERYQNRRRMVYTVTSTLTQAEINAQQPRGYKMHDIGSIDRRLEAVEYYLALTLAEQATQNRRLNSSLNNNTDRFKFGFFVDSFADSARSDVNNPEYTADISENVLKPRATRFTIPLIPNDDESLVDGVFTLPYNEYTLINQASATDGPVFVAPIPSVVVSPDTGTIITPPSGPVPGPVDPVPVVTQTQSIAFVRNAHELVNISGRVSETSEFVFSSTDGQAELYLNFRDNKNGIEIYQSTAPGFSVVGLTPLKDARAAVAVSNYEKTSKMYGMGKHETLDSVVYLGSPSKPATEDSGKIVWTHEASKGRYYKIVVIKYKKSGSIFGDTKGEFKYRLFYPTDVNVPAPITTFPFAIGFGGMVTRIEPPTFGSSSWATGVEIINYSDGQTFTISVVGLKASTQHNFFFDGVNLTTKCRMIGTTALGSGLISSETGTIDFEFFYDAGVAPAVSEFQTTNNINNQIASNKLIRISSSDDTSSAIGLILAKTYTQVAATYSGNSGGENGHNENVNLV